jgi:hypothetical protein
MSRIIGVCGRKRHGKDSVGKILRDHYGFIPTAFADPVKRVAMDVYGLSWEQCYGDGPEKEAVEPRWGLSPRKIMQLLGTEVGRSIHPDTWVKHTLSNIQCAEEGRGFRWRNDRTREFVHQWTAPPEGWVITDVRFPNEAEAIWEVGGEVWKVVRPSLGPPEDEHPSETSVDLVIEDRTLTNNGTLEELARAVAKAYRLFEGSRGKQ